MKPTKKMKTHSLDEVTDKYIGKAGTKKRVAFEKKLKLDLSKRKFLAKKLRGESKLVSEDSMKVLTEFENLLRISQNIVV